MCREGGYASDKKKWDYALAAVDAGDPFVEEGSLNSDVQEVRLTLTHNVLRGI